VAQPSLTPQENRLAAFCRVFAFLYFAGGLAFAVLPEWTYRVASAGADFGVYGPETAFWNVLAVAMMTGAGTACLVTAARPRERRHAMLSVVVAKLTSSALAAVHLLEKNPEPALTDIREGLAGNLCRCTGYMQIFEAVAGSCRHRPSKSGRRSS